MSERYVVVTVEKQPGTRLARRINILDGPYNMETPGTTDEDILAEARESAMSLCKDDLPGFEVIRSRVLNEQD